MQRQEEGPFRLKGTDGGWCGGFCVCVQTGGVVLFANKCVFPRLRCHVHQLLFPVLAFNALDACVCAKMKHCGPAWGLCVCSIMTHQQWLHYKYHKEIQIKC